MTEYIRGWRQLKAIFYLFLCLFQRNLLCAKRELEIMTGFAKPYKIYFAPTFWESFRKLGATDEDIEELKRKFDREVKR